MSRRLVYPARGHAWLRRFYHYPRPALGLQHLPLSCFADLCVPRFLPAAPGIGFHHPRQIPETQKNPTPPDLLIFRPLGLWAVNPGAALMGLCMLALTFKRMSRRITIRHSLRSPLRFC